MVSKRRISRGIASGKKRARKPDQVEKEDDEEFPEEEQALTIDTTNECAPDDNGGDLDESNEGDEEEEEERKNKYEVRQRVLARDEDGILYYATVRRKLYGLNQQKTISCLGIFDISPEDILETSGTNNSKEGNGEEGENDKKTQDSEQSEWHYFVHYEGWKTIWDRWVSENYIWEVTPDNIERMKEISRSHKALQLEFKEKTKARKIKNAGLFLQQWKLRLDALNRRWDEKETQTNSDNESKEKERAKKLAAAKRRRQEAKKKKGKSPQEVLRDQSNLAVQSCLVNRQASHIQAIPLSFGLKRILVEDWENLNNSNYTAKKSGDGGDATDEAKNLDMVHILPAKVTIRDALSLYLKEKGISWDGNDRDKSSTGKSRADQNSEEKSTEVGDVAMEKTDEKNPTGLEENSERNVAVEDASGVDSAHNDMGSNNGKGMSDELVKEWTDMAEGIVLYFEQALMTRLLYPSETSQILVLEDNLLEGKNDESTNKSPAMLPPKVDIYGCEHLLRLLSALPRILDQQLQESREKKLGRDRVRENKVGVGEDGPKTEDCPNGDDEDADQDAFAEIGSMILAKLQDLARFLQKNQTTLFGSMYRRKNEQEIKRDLKIQKRQERRLRNAMAMATPLNSVQQLEDQGSCKVEPTDDENLRTIGN